MRICPLLVCLWWASSLTAQRVAEAEPNNTPATAQVVTLGSQVDCTLTPGDVDWFRFTTAGGNVRMFVSGTIDSQLELWDAGATVQLAFSDDVRGASSLQSDLSINLAAGTYLCCVHGYGPGTAGPYSLDLGVIAAKPFTVAEVEPNNSMATAQAITSPAQVNASLGATELLPVITANTNIAVFSSDTYTLLAGTWAKQPQPGNILTFSGFTNAPNNGMHQVVSATTNTITVVTAAPYAVLAGEPAGNPVSIDAGDEDWYRIVLTTESAVWIQVTEGENTCIPRSRYEIYDSAGAPLNAANLGPASSDGSAFDFRQSVLRVWPAGTYYFVVKQSNLIGVTNTTMSPFGNYRLELLVQPMATGALVPEGPEPNQDMAHATPLLPGEVGVGNITVNTGADPSDWWGPFHMFGPSVITYQTTNGATPALLDSTINLRDATTGEILISSTDGNILAMPTGLHARQTARSSVPLDFYLEVTSPGLAPGQSGNYLLQVSSIDPLPYVTATYAVVPVNLACGPAPRPELSTQFSNEVPVLGTTFSRSLGGTAPAAPFFLLEGLTNQAASGGLVPLPYDLSALGAPGCTLNVDPLGTLLFVGSPSGITILNQHTATALGLRGLPVYEQCAVLVPTANALGIQMSNYAVQVLGERSY